jgi:hypothetical protein
VVHRIQDQLNNMWWAVLKHPAYSWTYCHAIFTSWDC